MKFTKTSILVSTIILTLGVAVSWRDYRQLVSARASQSELTAKLAGVGIRFDLSQPREKVGIAKRQREKKEENHHESSSDLLALIREITADIKNSNNFDPTESAKLRDFRNRLESLETAQWRALLTEIQADKAFEEYGDTNAILSAVVGQMGVYFRDSDQPQTFLALATQFPVLFKDNRGGQDFMGQNLLLWTKEDPAAAVAWLRENLAIFPRLANSYAVSEEMLSIVAVTDPAQAFRLIDELGITRRDIAARDITRYAETDENRTAILSAFQHYVSGMPEGGERDAILNSGVAGLVESAMMQGFETGTEWISHAGITPEQYAGALDYVVYDSKFYSSKNQWIDWLIPHLPKEQAAEQIGKLVTVWVKKDYKSAGEWISHNADGPVKNAAIHAYSYEVAAYEPAVAEQWAMTLPPGEARKNALQGVYKNWLETDPGGKEAFGKRHGLE